MLMEAAWLITKRAIYYTICQYWIKVFAITFGMGVVSGIVMEFQLGTNWSGFSRMVGPVLGELFTYEVLTAFFIEAGFLGVMLFGAHSTLDVKKHLSSWSNNPSLMPLVNLMSKLNRPNPTFNPDSAKARSRLIPRYV